MRWVSRLQKIVAEAARLPVAEGKEEEEGEAADTSIGDRQLHRCTQMAVRDVTYSMEHAFTFNGMSWLLSLHHYLPNPYAATATATHCQCCVTVAIATLMKLSNIIVDGFAKRGIDVLKDGSLASGEEEATGRSWYGGRFLEWKQRSDNDMALSHTPSAAALRNSFKTLITLLAPFAPHSGEAAVFPPLLS